METLRVELKPFGVNVLSVVTGVVRSNAQNWKHFEDWKLPEDSIYKPLESLIHERIQEKDGVYNDGAVRVDTMQHASKLADKILAGTTGTIWVGGQAGGVQVATTHLPQSVLVRRFALCCFSFKLTAIAGQGCFNWVWAREAFNAVVMMKYSIDSLILLAALSS